MYYYDPDNKSPRRWAMIATAVYGVLLAGCVWLEGKLDARIERKSCCDLDNLKKEAE